MGLKMTCQIMDGVLVSGETDEDHHQNIVNLFDRFRQYGLRVKPLKCSGVYADDCHLHGP